MGRHASGKVPAQPLLEIKTRHRDMMYLILAGMTGVQICEKMNISQSRLSVIRNSPLFKDELERLEAMVETKAIDRKANLNARVHDLQFKALDTLEDMLEHSKVDVLKRAIANDVLDLGTLKPSNKPNGAGASSDDFTNFLGMAFDLARQRRETGQNTAHEIESDNPINVTPNDQSQGAEQPKQDQESDAMPEFDV